MIPLIARKRLYSLSAIVDSNPLFPNGMRNHNAQFFGGFEWRTTSQTQAYAERMRSTQAYICAERQ